jgi:hypothetical protein
MVDLMLGASHQARPVDNSKPNTDLQKGRCDVTRYGVSADLLHGFGRVMLQSDRWPTQRMTSVAWKRRGGDGQAERLSGLQVDDQLKRGGLLHGQVGGLGAFEDLVHIDGRAAAEVARAWPVGHEAAGLHKRPDVVHGRQVVRGRECCEPAAVLKEHGVPQDEERPRGRLGHGREGAVKRVGTARLHEVQLDTQRLGRHLRRPHGGGVDWIVGIPEDGHAGNGGEHFLGIFAQPPKKVYSRIDGV